MNPLRTAACLLLLGRLAAAAGVPLELPRPVDPRLHIELYADAPDIVTPIGAAVDARGRLHVLESHTHLAPADYSGPKSDRVLVFEGRRPDGRAADRRVFADDLVEGLNLAFAPDGTLYVVTAKTVAALPDRDGDGRADANEIVLRLETEQRYPHNQLLGLTISPDGWLYVSRGNTGGDPHAWVGADGRRLPGYGNGGDIVRCRLDGTGLEPVATGFWNPFDLKFDHAGRLLCVDNAPDSRGPNRLLHIVAGGDYGFKSHYGPSGLHPYNAWDGELPGTLPMLAGIGESPSAVLDLSFAALPPDYAGAIAATIWGEHHVAVVLPQPAGVSLRGIAQPLIRGGKWFRPVALVAAPDGTVYITDWVLKDYPNHGQGRIWKLTTAAGHPTARPRAPAATSRLQPAPPPASTADRHLALHSPDPFVRHAAIAALATRPEVAGRDLAHADAAVRLGALLALRRAAIAEPDAAVRTALTDPDAAVRLVALMWAGERELRPLARLIDDAVAREPVTPPLFDTWLATAQILRAPPPPAGAPRPGGFRIRRAPDLDLLAGVATDPARPAPLRALALRRLADRPDALAPAVWLDLARSGDPALRLEAIRTLGAGSAPEAVARLRAIALADREPATLRAAAVVALGTLDPGAIAPLLDDADAAVRSQAARTLRRLPAETPPAPSDAEAWIRLLAAGGDPVAGERVFFTPTSACAQCHRIDGRGGTLGPDLSLVARTADRAQLIRSIVDPSADVAPQFQGWEITSRSGEIHTGLQGHWRSGGAASIVLPSGVQKTIPARDLATFRALEKSLMPEGLAALFSIEELRDLVAFLAQRR